MLRTKHILPFAHNIFQKKKGKKSTRESSHREHGADNLRVCPLGSLERFDQGSCWNQTEFPGPRGAFFIELSFGTVIMRATHRKLLSNRN